MFGTNICRREPTPPAFETCAKKTGLFLKPVILALRISAKKKKRYEGPSRKKGFERTSLSVGTVRCSQWVFWEQCLKSICLRRLSKRVSLASQREHLCTRFSPPCMSFLCRDRDLMLRCAKQYGQGAVSGFRPLLGRWPEDQVPVCPSSSCTTAGIGKKRHVLQDIPEVSTGAHVWCSFPASSLSGGALRQRSWCLWRSENGPQEKSF